MASKKFHNSHKAQQVDNRFIAMSILPLVFNHHEWAYYLKGEGGGRNCSKYSDYILIMYRIPWYTACNFISNTHS